LVKELTKRIVERVLETELSEHLGYEKHDPVGRGSGNNRNGKGHKTVHTESGSIDMEVPRDRNSTFEPQLIKKRQRRLEGFDEKVLALYSRGMSTREIQSHLEDLLELMFLLRSSPMLLMRWWTRYGLGSQGRCRRYILYYTLMPFL